MKREYKIKARVWMYPGSAAWHFVTLPKRDAKEIEFYFAHVKRGFGSLPVTVTVGKTIWKTSIFTDKKAKSFLLPIKAEVRKKESIKDGDTIIFTLEINN